MFLYYIFRNYIIQKFTKLYSTNIFFILIEIDCLHWHWEESINDYNPMIIDFIRDNFIEGPPKTLSRPLRRNEYEFPNWYTASEWLHVMMHLRHFFTNIVSRILNEFLFYFIAFRLILLVVYLACFF